MGRKKTDFKTQIENRGPSLNISHDGTSSNDDSFQSGGDFGIKLDFFDPIKEETEDINTTDKGSGKVSG